MSHMHEMNPATRICSWLLLAMATLILSACAPDDSALMCIEQAAGPQSIAVSNRCNETVVVMADDGEKLVIASGLTHQLLGAGKSIGACFAPQQPVIENSEFRCD